MSQLDGKKILVIKLRYIGDALGLLPVIENINEALELSNDITYGRNSD